MAKKSTPSDPILNLSTLIERPKITIDGTPYEILSPDELTIVNFQRFASWGQRIGEIMSMGEIDGSQEEELSHLIVELTDGVMVDVPQEVRDRLGDALRMQIAEVFILLPLPRWLGMARRAGVKTPGKPPIGGKRRRGSSASTAGRQGGGSSRPRFPSSKPT